jgi:hypothetical protein
MATGEDKENQKSLRRDDPRHRTSIPLVQEWKLPEGLETSIDAAIAALVTKGAMTKERPLLQFVMEAPNADMEQTPGSPAYRAKTDSRTWHALTAIARLGLPYGVSAMTAQPKQAQPGDAHHVLAVLLGADVGSDA